MKGYLDKFNGVLYDSRSQESKALENYVGCVLTMNDEKFRDNYPEVYLQYPFESFDVTKYAKERGLQKENGQKLSSESKQFLIDRVALLMYITSDTETVWQYMYQDDKKQRVQNQINEVLGNICKLEQKECDEILEAGIKKANQVRKSKKIDKLVQPEEAYDSDEESYFAEEPESDEEIVAEEPESDEKIVTKKVDKLAEYKERINEIKSREHKNCTNRRKVQDLFNLWDEIYGSMSTDSFAIKELHDTIKSEMEKLKISNLTVKLHPTYREDYEDQQKMFKTMERQYNSSVWNMDALLEGKKKSNSPEFNDLLDKVAVLAKSDTKSADKRQQIQMRADAIKAADKYIWKKMKQHFSVGEREEIKESLLWEKIKDRKEIQSIYPNRAVFNIIVSDEQKQKLYKEHGIDKELRKYMLENGPERFHTASGRKRIDAAIKLRNELARDVKEMIAEEKQKQQQKQPQKQNENVISSNQKQKSGPSLQ